MFGSEAIARLRADPAVGDIKAANRSLTWSVLRDPAEPYLNDHRPGGKPLLGTVGQLDAVAQGLCALMAGKTLIKIIDVEVAAPLIFETDAAQRLIISAELVSDDRLKVVSYSQTGATKLVHLTGLFEFGAGFTIGPKSEIPTFNAASAGQPDIYACLFHGAAFQVVAHAERRGDRMISQSASSLPAWAKRSTASTIKPRLIEFGLQTAGLFQLALDETMMIPKRIGTIERFADADLADEPLYAAATVNDAGGMDMQISDGDGTVLLQVRGYVCERLPFRHDNAAATALAQRLNLAPAGTD